MSTWEIVNGDSREILKRICDLDFNAGRNQTVIVTDPVWPNAPDGLFDVKDPMKLFRDVGKQFARTARRCVIQIGCDSDPRFLSAIPKTMPFVRACWMRYLIPSYKGPVLNGADVAYVFGSNEGYEREEPRSHLRSPSGSGLART